VNFKNSNALLNKTKDIIPICTQTFSKSPSYFPIGASPLFIEKGKGSHVWDVDNNEFIDYICALGPITLGYNYPVVNDAITEQLDKGIIFSLPSPLEFELSKKITEIVPCAEMVRFLKTGSEACQAVVRLARAYTKRNHITYRGYHGWHEWWAAGSERPEGIPITYKQYIKQFNYNDIDSLEKRFEDFDLAAVIMEPMITEPPMPGFLEQVRDLCDAHGTVLIFDETVTGFRWALGGAQQYFGVTPDLTVFGKGVANGMPLAVICGKKDIMQKFEDVFVSSTFGGECLSLAAGIATIQHMQTMNTIAHCWDMGNRLVNGLREIGVNSIGFPCRPLLQLENDSPELRSLLMQELISRHVLIHNGLLINLCYSHSVDDIDQTLNAFEDSLKAIKSGATLKGEVVHTAFKRI